VLRGTTTGAVEHSRAMPPEGGGGDETATNPRGKWRFSPTFRGVMRWRTKDAPDHAMRCRLAGNLSGKATCTQ
jgi:hypothetical protein